MEADNWWAMEMGRHLMRDLNKFWKSQNNLQRPAAGKITAEDKEEGKELRNCSS